MKLTKISDEAMKENVEAFSEYQYEDGEEGLHYLCKGKKELRSM